MSKTIALIALLQATLVFSPMVRADDAKPAAADSGKVDGVNAPNPAVTGKTAKADTKVHTKDAKSDKDCDCKDCAGKKGKKSCKTCEHCKMHHHDAKAGDEKADPHAHDEADVEGTTHEKK